MFLDYVMTFFSCIGEAGGVWLIAAIIMLCFRKTRAAGVMIICAVAAGFFIGDICLKNIAERARPFIQNPSVQPLGVFPKSFSFPSGHSCSSFAAAVVIFYRNKKCGIAALAVAFLIAFSRVYNYAHFPSDVLCGVFLGVLCAVITIAVFRGTGLELKLSGDLKYKKIRDGGKKE